MDQITSLSSAERAYLSSRYAEEGARARAFAEQRSTNTNIFLVLIVGVLAFDVGGSGAEDYLVGVFILFTSLIGAAMSLKYNKRQNIHEKLCADIGNALSLETRSELRFPDDVGIDRRLSRSSALNLALNYVSAWYILYFISGVVGLALVSGQFHLQHSPQATPIHGRA